MNMQEIRKHVHDMVNTDVVDVDIKLVPSLFSAYQEEQVQMKMSLAVQRSDFSMRQERDLEYYDFSMKSGYVVWDDDEKVKAMLSHMVLYMSRKIGNMIMLGREGT